AATVTRAKRLPKPPKGVPTGVGRVADRAPSAQVADPGQGAVFQVGTTVHPLIRGTDDFAIASATLLVNGTRVGTSTVAPYLFDWTPSARDAGRQVKLQALVVDSSGRATLSKAVVGTVLPPPTVKLGKVTTNTKTGTATIAATVNTAGTLTLTGDKVVAVTRQVSKAGTVTLTVTVDPAYRQELVKAGRLDVTVTVAFGTATGQSASKTVQVRLLKK
ncbi:alpha/beta hydrolase, partial [Micromonospora sp. DH15]|nr:alpha/beta hydrolase [Micromonospora sp. DH15]